MSVVNDYLGNNKSYSSQFNEGGLAMPPSKNVAEVEVEAFVLGHASYPVVEPLSGETTVVGSLVLGAGQPARRGPRYGPRACGARYPLPSSAPLRRSRGRPSSLITFSPLPLRTLDVDSVVSIYRVKDSFWTRLDGSLDVGYGYT